MDTKLVKDKFNYFDKNNLILIDGSGYIFRAYYALPPMTNPEGIPINAVYGFMNMMVKLVDDFKPKNIAVAFDFARETFRNKIFQDYKSNRTAPPEDLIPQFSLIKKATEALGLPILELEGYEADDLIATYQGMAHKEKRKVVIVSSDKDLMQLIDDNTVMLDPMKQTWIDEEKVLEKFGVKPDKVIDVQSLAGDTSDNVPGVPGIGIKIAAELINHFGSLDQVFLRTSEIKQNKRRENLDFYKDQALISKKLVTLKKDVPIEKSVSNLDFNLDFSSPTLINFIKHHNFKRLLDRLESYPKGDQVTNFSNDQKIIKNSNFKDRNKNYKLITSTDELEKFLEQCSQHDVIAIDCETDSLNAKSTSLVGISIAYKEGEACYIPLRHGLNLNNEDLLSLDEKSKFPKQIEFNLAISKLKLIFEDESILKVGHNIKFDSLVLKQEKNGLICVSPIGDTMCMSYVLNLGKTSSHKLDNLALIELNYNTIKFEDVCGKGVKQKTFDQINPIEAYEYAAEDSDVTLALYNLYLPRLYDERKLTIYEKLERALIKVITNIENQGIIVNPITLNNISIQLAKKIKLLEKEIFKITENEFNIGSPKQLGEILFEKLNIKGGKKSKNGSWQTSVTILEDLAQSGYKIADHLLNWRHFSKLKSTYSEALVEQLNKETKRIHTSYSMVGTSTGRLSSSDPNLQNIPIRTDEGKLIRTAFEAPENCYLLSMDYSQIELRLIAHIADEKSMIQAFNEHLDIHTDTASKVFNISSDKISANLRRSAKAINFGIIYGISPFGLAKQLKCSNTEAKEFIDSYFVRFPNIKDYMQNIRKQLFDDGFVETLFGRRIYFSNLDTKNNNLKLFAERQAINAPIQGTAADIIKLAMIRLDNYFVENNIDIKMLLQVHDELVFEVSKEKIEEAIEKIKPIMEQVNLPMRPLKVKLKVDHGFSNNWADAH